MKKNLKVNDRAFDFEASKSFLLEKSARRAWLISYVMIGLVVVSLMTIMFMMQLKQSVPYLIKVSELTGATEIMTVLNQQQISEDDALDKFFIGRYVKSREQYYYPTIQQDYTLTQLYSAPSVKKAYLEIYDDADSRVNKLKNKFAVDAEIISIVLNRTPNNNIATIRTRLTTKLTDNPSEKRSEIEVITLTYEYKLDQILHAAQRIDNPFGFVVTSYRKDKEIN